MTEIAQEDLARQTASGLSWQMLGSVLRALSSFVFGVVLARLLPPEDFGIVAMASLATSLAYVVVDLGLGPALVQRASITDRHVRVAHTISVVVAVLITVALFLGAGAIARFFNDERLAPVLGVLAFSFLIYGFSITAGALLQRRLAFKALFKIELTASVAGYGVVGVAMAAAGYGYWSLVGGTIAQAALASALTYAAVRHSLRPLVAGGEVRDLMGFSVGMSLTSMVNYFALKGDYLVVGRLLSATSVGLYARAYTLMELPHAFVGTALSRVLFPAAARVQHEPERFRRAYLTTLSVSVAVSLPISLALVVLAPELIRTLYGEEWAPAVPLLQILSLFGMFRMTYNTASAFIRARGHIYTLFWITVVYGVLVVAGGWMAAPAAGTEGVAWAVGGALTVMWLLAIGFANAAASVRVGEFARALARASGPGAGLALCLWGLVTGLRTIGLPSLMILLLAGCSFASALAAILVYQARRLDHGAIDSILERLTTVGARARGALCRALPAAVTR